MEFQRDEQRLYRIVYHLVWTPKRRKAVLTGDIAQDCRRLIEEKCIEEGWDIIELTIKPDYVHLNIRVWPSTSAADVVRVCKRATSQVLRKKYPQLLRLPSLWTRNYFAATSGDVSPQMIKGYIDTQKGK
ncbi:MAG: IS200/IS605 family transposase [Phototrophicales bacterium]|nr:MAG: IS200/IS605 family transposase [Phototrophicales bacterium]